MLATAIWMLLILLIISSTTETLAPKDVLVHLSSGGTVRGVTLTSEKGRPFDAFRGIPYAEPPIRELRFKAPVPKASWKEENVFDATKDGPVCFQEGQPANKSFVGEEDCLHLNVYTPQIQNKCTNSSKKSVMIFIHGGGFQRGDGTSTTFPPERFMDSDIVLVTINYRLGALGFLSTSDSSSPGNYGLLDQVLAFQWVKDNIMPFGGDPDFITIFGESSGGVSVSYQLISPLSKGLFQRAIEMSGSSLATDAFESHPLRWAKRLASQADCPQQPTSAMVECFRGKPLKDLMLNLPDTPPISPFSPSVDGHFLTAPPKEILTYFPDKINNVTVLSGCTEMEASGVVSWMKELKPNASLASEEVFDFLFNDSSSNYDINIINMIRDRYLNSVDVTNEIEANKAVVKAATDGNGLMSHYAEVQLLAKAGLDVYVYSYDYAMMNSDEVTKLYGVGHVQDLYVLFNVLPEPFEDDDYKMVDIMTNIWSNFAKTGNPDPAHKYLPEWKPSSPELFHIHHLNLSITIEDYDVNKDQMFAFWMHDVEAARNGTNYT